MEDHRLPACNPQIQHQPSSLQSFQAADDDDFFLQQMLSDLLTMSWLPNLSNPNPNNPLLHYDADADAFLRSSNLQNFSPMAAASAESFLVQQQLFSTDNIPGAGANIGLAPFPSSLTDAEGPSFISTPQGASDDSVQALYSAAFPAHQPFHFQAGEIPAILQTQQGYNTAFPAQQPIQATEIPDLNEPPPSEQAPETQTVRARTGQAPKPRSLNERRRRQKIADRIKALQLLVPNANSTNRDAILDEIIEYVKFLKLAVEVLSTNTLEGAAHHLTEGGAGSSHDGMSVTEQHELVLKLMKEDMGSAMLYLQTKGLHLVPVSIATEIILRYYANGNGHGVEA